MCFENIKPTTIEYPKIDEDDRAIHETHVELDRMSVDFKIPIQHLNTDVTYDGSLYIVADSEFGVLMQIGNDDATLQEFNIAMRSNDMYALYMFLHYQLHVPFAKYLQQKVYELDCRCHKFFTTEDIDKIIDDWSDEE